MYSKINWTQNSYIPEQDNVTQLFTLSSLGDTWFKLVLVHQKGSLYPKSTLCQPDHGFAHRWTSMCNLRVDKDSTPGACSMRKIMQRSKTAFIFPSSFYFCLDSSSSCCCDVAFFSILDRNYARWKEEKQHGLNLNAPDFINKTTLRSEGAR